MSGAAPDGPGAAPAHAGRLSAALVLLALAAALGAVLYLRRAGAPLTTVEACRSGYAAARTRAETLAVDARALPVTPTPRSRRALRSAPHTCGRWREEYWTPDEF